MNNAPSARMPAAGTQALLPIRLVVSAWPPGKCWQLVIGRNGWRRVAVNASPPAAGLGSLLPQPSAAVHALSVHRTTPKSGEHGHIADVAGSEFRFITHNRRPVKPFRAGSGFTPESPIRTPCTTVAPMQTSSARVT